MPEYNCPDCAYAGRPMPVVEHIDGYLSTFEIRDLIRGDTNQMPNLNRILTLGGEKWLTTLVAGRHVHYEMLHEDDGRVVVDRYLGRITR